MPSVATEIKDLKVIARWRWDALLPALGVPAAVLDGKPHGCPCAGCPSEKDGFRYKNTDGHGEWYCNGKGNGHFGDGLDLAMEVTGIGYGDAIRELCGLVGAIWAGAGFSPAQYKPFLLRSEGHRAYIHHLRDTDYADQYRQRDADAAAWTDTGGERVDDSEPAGE